MIAVLYLLVPGTSTVPVPVPGNFIKYSRPYIQSLYSIVIFVLRGLTIVAFCVQVQYHFAQTIPRPNLRTREIYCRLITETGRE